jgi:hypothetical protein
MNKNYTWRIFGTYMLLILLLLVSGGAFSQTKFCKQEVCVVEFNAGWNKANSVEWLDDLKDCGVTRISIDEGKMLERVKKDYNITVVPTIIVFNGKEVERFQACLRFKIGATKEEVQAVIDEIIMKKF